MLTGVHAAINCAMSACFTAVHRPINTEQCLIVLWLNFVVLTFGLIQYALLCKAGLCNAMQAVNDAMREALKPEDLQHYAILGRDTDIEAALPDGSVPARGIVNVKSQGDRKTTDSGDKRKREGKMYQKGGNKGGKGHKQDGGRKHASKRQRA